MTTTYKIMSVLLGVVLLATGAALAWSAIPSLQVLINDTLLLGSDSYLMASWGLSGAAEAGTQVEAPSTMPDPNLTADALGMTATALTAIVLGALALMWSSREEAH